MKKTINTLSVSLMLIFALGPMSDGQSADLDEGEVYLAGQAFTLEQALSQALAENPADSKRRFWVVVAGRDALLATADANVGVRDSIKRIQQRGGIIYVCRSDMQAHGIKSSDLIPGAAPVQGFGGPPAESSSSPLTQSDRALPSDLQHARLILRSCADNTVTEDAAKTPSQLDAGTAR